jgi:predicted ribosome quality control (RQC) complex YloA/Tae2 family protein
MIEKTLSWAEIRILTREITGKLKGARINKVSIRMDDKKTILNLKIHKPNLEEKNLCFIIPECFFLSGKNPTMPTKPYQTTMLLRKYLSGGFIQEFRQIGSERAIEIKISTKEMIYSLFLEFIPPGNVVLTDKDNKILVAHSKQKWKDRTIKRGEEYHLPSSEDLSGIKERDFINLLKEDKDKKIVVALARKLRVGGDISEELLERKNVNKNQKVEGVSSEKLKGIFKEFKSMVDSESHGYLYEKANIFPFGMKSCGEVEKEYESFSKALADNCFPEKKAVSKHNKEIKKIKQIIKSQENKIEEMEQKREEMLEKGNAIYSNYQKIAKVLELLKGHSMEEIKEKIKEGNKEDVVKIKDKKRIGLNLDKI